MSTKQSYSCHLLSFSLLLDFSDVRRSAFNFCGSVQYYFSPKELWKNCISYQQQCALLNHCSNCGMFSHTLVVHDQNTVACYLISTPKLYKGASASEKVKAKSFEDNFDLLIIINQKMQSDVMSSIETRCALYCNKRHVKRFTFETLWNA